MYLQGLANFLDDTLGGVALLGFSFIVGGLLWRAVVLGPESGNAHLSLILHRNAWGVLIGAVVLAAATLLGLIVQGWLVASALGEFPLSAYSGTVQFKAGVLRFLLASALAIGARRLLRIPHRQFAWIVAVLLALPLIICGAWLVHAVGRFENRGWLMTVTVIHQCSAGVWAGGLFQLLLLRSLGRRDAAARAFWPTALSRFARMGIPAVLVLITTGMLLASSYVGSWGGLVGTAYGSLIAVKTALLGGALGFALLNHRAARRSLRSEIEHKVPCYLETEFLLLAAVLFIASSLSSQPPAADIPELTASLSEVAGMFAPGLPRLVSPSHAEFLAGEAGRLAVVDYVPSWASAAWSDYNHNVCGLLLTAMAFIALLSYHPRFPWARYWPLGFAGLGLFLFFRNDPQAWPLGPLGFWESTFGDGEIMQHRIATLATFAMAAVEIRSRSGKGSINLSYVFPALMAFGAIILFLHGHAGFEPKSEYLIRATHNSIGFLAVIMACGRWLELRLRQAGQITESRRAGLAGCLVMLGVGMILLFYREPMY